MATNLLLVNHLLMGVHLVIWCMQAECQNLPLEWTDSNITSPAFNNLLLSPDGQHLYVSGQSNIYNLNASNLQLLNKGSLLTSKINLIIYNNSASGKELVTCGAGGTTDHCDIRQGSLVNSISGRLDKSIIVDNSVAFTVSVNTTAGTTDNFLFLGCPHARDVPVMDRCEHPGLTWFLDGSTIKSNDYFFKSYLETPVYTRKYVNGFNIGDFRIFFSVQEVRSGGLFRSRVAQVCQHHLGDSPPCNHKKYTTSLTYADMNIQCGDYTIIQAVQEVAVEGDHVFVAVFAKANVESAVCVYTLSSMESRFVDNIKDCYRREGPSNEEDYISFNSVSRPCKISSSSLALNQSHDSILCNKGCLDSFHHVIGKQALQQDPTLTFTFNITTVTLATIDSKIAAFLGSSDGKIFKATVYPTEAVSKINQAVSMHEPGFPILQDIYTSPDNNFIYYFTAKKVFKMPVEMCSSIDSCEDCLQSQDPYCGWCFLENRCSRKETCMTPQWIAATGNGQCPKVTSVSPTIMSNKEIYELEITLSHGLNGTDVSCTFYNKQAKVNFTKPATLKDGFKTVQCRPSDIAALERNIKGFLDVKVLIATNISDAALVETQFIFYKCDTFERCSDCSAQNWTCKWCSFNNSCINDSENCSPGLQEGQTSCPEVLRYEVLPTDHGVKDDKGTAHFSFMQNYKVRASGNNLPQPAESNNQYTCELVINGTTKVQFEAFSSPNQVSCTVDKEKMTNILMIGGQMASQLHVVWRGKVVEGSSLPVDFYDCEKLAENNCGQCQSFATYKPYYQCVWCDRVCQDGEAECNATDTKCGDPLILQVYPLSVHPNAVTRMEITGRNLGSSFNETVGAVMIAGLNCTSLDDTGSDSEGNFVPGVKISCILPKSDVEKEGDVTVTLSNGATGTFSRKIQFRFPHVTSVVPRVGPLSGGTLVTLHGEHLDTGRERKVFIGQSCDTQRLVRVLSGELKRAKDQSLYVHLREEAVLVCRTRAWNETILLDINVTFDGAEGVSREQNLTYSYVEDPVIKDVRPKKSFQSGGRTLTVKGTNLYAIQRPKIYAEIDGRKTPAEECKPDVNNTGEIFCPSPKMLEMARKRRSIPESLVSIGFVMDDVASVSAENLMLKLVYYPDPDLENLTEVKSYKDLQQNHLSIKGHNLLLAATKEDVKVAIGCGDCNITIVSDEAIYCEPPPDLPICNRSTENNRFVIKVKIGYFERDVGMVAYEPLSNKLEGDRKTEYIVAGTVCGVLVLGLIAASIVVVVMFKRGKIMQKKNKGLEYKMDKLEATYRTKCREEFAALQTAVADLTSDLAGGNVLFRDYSVYARKVLFSSQRSDPLLNPPPVMTEEAQMAMDTYKNLLRNRQFLLMLVRTLEKQNSFTIHDRSNVATVLMVLNHDNMEYITGILMTLLTDLIEKNIAANTPKLLLRSSGFVAEKLLTHWLSVCLYHYLKEKLGHQLFLLYKAIKILTEKGPIDYISNCGKYTLSEDRLITIDESEINPVVLTLIVDHTDFLDNVEKEVRVQVLDCDTITQAKNKMLEVLYKNIPYSQRPSVHSLSFEIEETDTSGGTTVKRLLNDEDASSVKGGIWKQINTLRHYQVKDNCKVLLDVSTELNNSSLSLAGASPDSFIVGSFRRSKPVVRTVSGSEFWHLTKKQATDDEVKLSSDLFLPRLLNTKGTLQDYIDKLFGDVLSVDEEPPIIIKYLFDFLDSVAAKYSITDPDVLHTWKCNSLLLRFWVNIIKNPEFVFDIHKPQIVDACLSVITQTLMDSCSTADLVLGPSSPSNKLLFAKDIPRYKTLVRQYFEALKQIPAVSDQELNSFLTQKVSQKFSGEFHQSSALLEMYKYTAKYKKELCNEMDNLEASSPGSFSPLTSKLEYVFMTMEAYAK